MWTFFPPAFTGHLGVDIPSLSVHRPLWCRHSFPWHPWVTSVWTFTPLVSTGPLSVDIPSLGVQGSPRSLHSFHQHPQVSLASPCLSPSVHVSSQQAFLPPASMGHLDFSTPSPAPMNHFGMDIPSPHVHGSPRCGCYPLGRGKSQSQERPHRGH